VPIDARAVDPRLVVTTPDAAPRDYVLDYGELPIASGTTLASVKLRNRSGAPISITSCAIDKARLRQAA
jgi:hypothetical protein